jgi:hypothetical protein
LVTFTFVTAVWAGAEGAKKAESEERKTAAVCVNDPGFIAMKTSANEVEDAH